MTGPGRMSASEFMAARMLVGLTRAELATMSSCSVSSIERLELGLGTRTRTRCMLWETLRQLGIRKACDGRIVHVDGRATLDRKVVGRLSGERIRKARSRLGLSVEELAELAGLSCTSIRIFEVTPNLNEAPSLRLYALVGQLQLAGYQFRLGARGGRCADGRSAVQHC